MLVPHNRSNPELYGSQGPIKKHLQQSRNPQLYSAGKLPHARDVASCSSGGRQACRAFLPAGCSAHPALLVCCWWSMVSGLLPQYVEETTHLQGTLWGGDMKSAFFICFKCHISSTRSTASNVYLVPGRCAFMFGSMRSVRVRPGPSLSG